MISLGRHSYACNPELRGEMSHVIVGSYCSIGRGVIFDCGFNHEYKWVTSFCLHTVFPEAKSNVFSKGNTVVGNDVWIGENCFINSGITIGDGCVVGYGSIVTKSLKPYTVFTNHKSWWRFPALARIELLKIKWWQWDDDRIKRNLHLLQQEDIWRFINEHN